MAMIKTCPTPPIYVPKVSGPVCSFKALQALPLKNCEVAINAWQEGSGDPSPENVRTIHGWDECNLTRCGKNLLKKPVVRYTNSLNGFSSCFFLKAGTYILNIKSIENATKWRFAFIVYKSDGTIDSAQNFSANPTVYWSTNRYINNGDRVDKRQRITLNEDVYIRFFLDYGDVTSSTIIGNSQLEQGSSYTSYEPYNGNTYTIQLGEEVYGAEVDFVNGVAHVTHGYMEYDGSENWVATTVSGFPCFQIARGVLPTSAQFISNYIKRVVAMTASEFIGYIGGSNFNVRFTSDTTLEQFQEILSNNNMQIVYELATPFDIQLTSTQIDTILNTNNIFAYTGDTAVRYIQIGG